jgi:WD40 repeat protein
MRRIGAHDGHVDAIAITPGAGRFLVSRGRDGQLVRWSLDDGARETLAELEGGRALAIAPSGDWVVAGDETNLHRVPLTGGAAQPLGDPVEAWEMFEGALSAAFSPDGRLVAACGGDEQVVVRDLTGNTVWQGRTYKWPYVVRFTADGRLVVGTWDGELSIVPVDGRAGGVVDLSHPGVEYPGGPIFDAAPLPSGDVVICGAEARAGWIRIWNPQHRRYVASVKVEHGVHAIALSPDRRRLVAGGNGQAVELRELVELADVGHFLFGVPATGLAGGSFLGFYDTTGRAAVRALAWHPDGQHVYAGCEDGVIFEVSVAELAARGGVIDALELERTLRAASASVVKQERVASILKDGEVDPLGALAKLSKEAPEVADAVVGLALARADQEPDETPPPELEKPVRTKKPAAAKAKKKPAVTKATKKKPATKKPATKKKPKR